VDVLLDSLGRYWVHFNHPAIRIFNEVMYPGRRYAVAARQMFSFVPVDCPSIPDGRYRHHNAECLQDAFRHFLMLPS